MTPTVVVAFDVDGTLTTGDCVVPFLRRFARRPSVLLGALRQTRGGMTAVGGRDRDRLRAAVTAAVLAGVVHSRVELEAERFARRVVAARLRHDTEARLRWHVAAGHRVVLVSASYEAYLTHIARHLGAEDVLATRLEIGDDGRCTGRLLGANCRAGEKVRRLEGWMAERGLRRDQVELWAYGDSPGDRELLGWADHAIWVRSPLASVAPS